MKWNSLLKNVSSLHLQHRWSRYSYYCTEIQRPLIRHGVHGDQTWLPSLLLHWKLDSTGFQVSVFCKVVFRFLVSHLGLFALCPLFPYVCTFWPKDLSFPAALFGFISTIAGADWANNLADLRGSPFLTPLTELTFLWGILAWEGHKPCACRPLSMKSLQRAFAKPGCCPPSHPPVTFEYSIWTVWPQVKVKKNSKNYWTLACRLPFLRGKG